MASRLVTIDEVLAEAVSILKSASELDKTFARQWIYRAQREIGFSHIDIKVSDNITLTDFSALKPDDFIKGIDIALFTSDGREIATGYKGWGSNNDISSARIHEDLRTVVKQIHVTEDIDYYHTEPFDEGESDTAYMIMKYYGLPIDENGLPLIPESNTLAIMMYVRWMWAMRENKSIASIQEAANEWKKHRIMAKARLTVPSVLEGKEAAKKLNSMIQKPVLKYRQF